MTYFYSHTLIVCSYYRVTQLTRMEVVAQVCTNKPIGKFHNSGTQKLRGKMSTKRGTIIVPTLCRTRPVSIIYTGYRSFLLALQGWYGNETALRGCETRNCIDRVCVQSAAMGIAYWPRGVYGVQWNLLISDARACERSKLCNVTCLAECVDIILRLSMHREKRR